jgi:glycine/D-amino acid oxidase-like deaminating enzyme
MLSLARDGISAYRNWAAFTGLAQPRAEFREEGVLWLPGGDPDWSDREFLRLRQCGIGAMVLDDAQLRERFPALNPCVMRADVETAESHDCRGGGRHLLETEGGYIDPVMAVQDLAEACRLTGVEVRFNAAVDKISVEGGRIVGVVLASGETIAAPCLVNAAGPWCQRLNAAAGVHLPWELVPTRIQMLYLDRPVVIEGRIPVTLDMAGGIYFRTQNRGQQLVVGSVLESDEREAVEDPDQYDLQPTDLFLQEKLHFLHHRIPDLPYRGRIRGYCGLYTVNRDDVHPLVGRTPVEGFWVANGFSGHGFKLAPAIGSMLAQAISGSGGEFDTAIPIDFFATDRAPIELAARSVLA